MINLTIDTKKISVTEGSTVLEAARLLGVDIPVMCMNKEAGHFASCMICLVKEVTTDIYLPACSATVTEGMQIVTTGNDLSEARKTSLDLLLSEHVGDCEAPCRVACPANMNIPFMNRLIARDKADEALQIILQDIALPGVLGHICPAPCEDACKRKPIDDAVAVCLLKRFTASESLYDFAVHTSDDSNKKVAVIGAGPAGLSAAFYIRKKGMHVHLYDNQALPGGSLRYAIAEELLPKKVLDKDIGLIMKSGIGFFPDRKVDGKMFETLRNNYDAVVIATGNYTDSMSDWGLNNNGRHFIVDKTNFTVNLENVLVIGNASRLGQMAVRSAADGKKVALVLNQLFTGKPLAGEVRRFNSTIGKLMPEEFNEYLKESSATERQPVIGNSGFAKEKAITEAARCMHCDCRKADSCLLRKYANEYDSKKKRFAFTPRKPSVKETAHKLLVFEKGKCIKCGICVRISEKYNEEFGFTFIGRGFDVEIGTPFNEALSNVFREIAFKVADACPTGAIAKK